MVSRVILLIIALSMNTGCDKSNKNKPLPGKHINLMQEIIYAKPDEALKNKEIIIPTAQVNHQWLSSNFDLNSVPQNIKIETPLSYQISRHSLLKANSMLTSTITPVIAEGVLYLADSRGNVAAYNTKNFSKPLWYKMALNKADIYDQVGGGLKLVQNTLVVTFGGKTIVALDKTSGEEIWTYNLSNIARSAPEIKNNLVYVLTIDNRLYCLNLHNGFVVWTHEGAVEQFSVFGSASPVTTEHLVIVPHSSGQLLALNAKTGESVWQLNLIKNVNNNTMLYLNDIDMTPVINQNTIYLSNYTGVMFAIDITTGHIKWTNDSVGGSKFIWIAGDYIYSVNNYQQLTAVLKQTGQVKWVQNIEDGTPKSKKDKLVLAGPIMINNILYFTSVDGMLIAFESTTGKKIYEYKIDKAVYSPPIAVERNIYFINNTGVLSVIW